MSRKISYKNNSIKIFAGLSFLMFFSLVFAVEQKTEFPGRQLYPDVSYVGLKEFFDNYSQNKILVVDVRSAYEYNTLRIKNAINIPIASTKFLSEIKQLRKTDSRPIVFYCNGKTCMKSYKATRKSMSGKINNVMAYDSGILDFAKAYPKYSVLLGKPLNSAKRIISKNRFKQHLMSPSNFGKRIADTSDILIDLRERMQRDDGISYFIGREHRVSLDNTRRLDRYINQAIKEHKTLLVYDAAGKQVRWLQYYFEDKALENYYFMEGGIAAYFEKTSSNSK